ncbi:MAG: PDZ domain-containing protein [Phycisphaerales bacterium]|nr:PDZ domain-containing protein [Phycisphaerales bacterium]
MLFMLVLLSWIACDSPCGASVSVAANPTAACVMACPPEDQAGVTSGRASRPQAWWGRQGVAATLMSMSPEDTDEPRTWIGVVVTDVPPSVAAQIGAGGLLVTNVAKESPADRAGVQQYDVIRSFNGKAVTELDSLISEISAVGTGKAVNVEVIRGGKSHAISVTPEQRSHSASEFEYKYEMPEDVVDESAKIRGHALRRNPDGTWQLDELGALDNLPGALRQLIEGHIGRNHAFSWSFPNDGEPVFNFNLNLDQSAPGESQFQIEVNRDGEKLALHRDSDGTIRVDRTDKDGKSSSTTYDNADALKDQDPEAHELYERMSHRQPMIMIDPNPEQIERLRNRYQEQIKRHMGERKQAIENRRSQSDPSENAAPRTNIQPRKMRPAAGNGMNVSIDTDGSIAVTVERDGQTIEYKFANEDDFKKREPKLFERYAKLRE